MGEPTGHAAQRRAMASGNRRSSDPQASPARRLFAKCGIRVCHRARMRVRVLGLVPSDLPRREAQTAHGRTGRRLHVAQQAQGERIARVGHAA
jgi:hypothetical protein